MMRWLNIVPHMRQPSVVNAMKAVEKTSLQALVLDYDNTLVPPEGTVLTTAHIADCHATLNACRRVFGSNVVICSNSIGSRSDLPDFSRAQAIEETFNVPVLRYGGKKPGNAAGEAILSHFQGIDKEHVCVVGDRLATDVVLGKRFGFFTVLVEPLIDDGESIFVKGCRQVEQMLLKWV